MHKNTPFLGVWTFKIFLTLAFMIFLNKIATEKVWHTIIFICLLHWLKRVSCLFLRQTLENLFENSHTYYFPVRSIRFHFRKNVRKLDNVFLLYWKQLQNYCYCLNFTNIICFWIYNFFKQNNGRKLARIQIDHFFLSRFFSGTDFLTFSCDLLKKILKNLLDSTHTIFLVMLYMIPWPKINLVKKRQFIFTLFMTIQNRV